MSPGTPPALRLKVQRPGVHKALTRFLQLTLLIGAVLFCFQGCWITRFIEDNPRLFDTRKK